MSNWFFKVKSDLNNLPDCIDFYLDELVEAKGELKLKGKLEKHSAELPSILENRFNQLQDLEAILQYLNYELDRIESQVYRKFLEHYKRALSSSDVKKYIDGEQEVVDQRNLVNEVALIRNQFIGVIKSLETKGFQINNIVKLRSAGLDDAAV